jgi:peroxiredoxin
VQKAYPQFQALGTEVAAVSFAPPPRVAAFLQEYPLPFPLLSDPTMAAYRYFSLARTSILSFFRWKVLAHYFRLILGGWLPTKPGKGDDLLQLGGDFLLDAQGRLAYAHPSQDGGDRPTITELVEATKKTTGLV